MSETYNSNLNGKRPRDEAFSKFRLTIKSQDDRTFTYNFDPEKKIRKVFKLHCKKLNLEHTTVEFFTEDGERIDPRKTPAELNIDDGDTIDAMTRQHGGGFSTCLNNLISV